MPGKERKRIMSERRIRMNKYRRQRELRRHIFISILTLCTAVILVSGIFSIQTDAKDASEAFEVKYYTSIMIENGDTLWTIASEYMGEHYESEEDYIKEVIHMNALRDDTIYEGRHLIIPYYASGVPDE